MQQHFWRAAPGSARATSGQCIPSSPHGALGIHTWASGLGLSHPEPKPPAALVASSATPTTTKHPASQCGETGSTPSRSSHRFYR